MNQHEKRWEAMRHMDEIGIYIEYVDVLLRDIVEKYLMALVHKKDCTPAVLVEFEGEAMLTKGEMVERFIGEISDHYHELTSYIFTPEPIPDHASMTNEQRVREITGDIEKAVEIIAARPDWLDTMKRLNAIVWTPATDRNTDKGEC